MNSTNSTPTYCLFTETILAHIYRVHRAQLTLCIVNSILALITCCENTVVLLTLWKTPSLYTIPNCFLFSLAASDLGVGLIAQPLNVAYNAMVLSLHEARPRRYDYVCIIGILKGSSEIYLTAVTLMSLMGISIERYLSIHLHLRYKEFVTFKRVVRVIVLLWLAALLGTACSTIYMYSYPPKYAITSTAVTTMCFISSSLLVIISCNVRIAIILRHHVNEIRSQQPTQDPQRDLIHHVNEIRSQRPTQHSQRDLTTYRKSLVLMLTFVVLFMLCYLPILGCLVARSIMGISTGVYIMYEVAATLMFLNSALNPIVYCWRMSCVRLAIISNAKNFYHRIIGMNNTADNNLHMLTISKENWSH